MSAQIPNLGLILYKAQQLFHRILKDRNQPDFTIEVFLQEWGDTCTGFDVTEYGEPLFGCCVMTEEYTVVVHERRTDRHYVFFGETPCYEVTHPNENFYDDLKNHHMVSLSKAKRRY